MNPLARLAALAASLERPKDFVIEAWERLPEADAIVDRCPAEETPLSDDDCVHMARRLVGGGDLTLEFAVFCALMERTILAEIK
jgi:hypothetical protein